LDWAQFGLLFIGFGGMGSVAYWKVRKDTIQMIDELKKDLPTAVDLLGKSLFKSVKGSNAAESANGVRMDKAVGERLLNDFLGSQPPLATMALDYGKETIPFLREHPVALEYALPYIQKFFGGGMCLGSPAGNRKERNLGSGK